MNRKHCLQQIEKFLEKKCVEGECIEDSDLYHDFLTTTDKLIAKNTNKNSFIAKVRFICYKRGWELRQTASHGDYKVLSRQSYEIRFKPTPGKVQEFSVVLNKV